MNSIHISDTIILEIALQSDISMLKNLRLVCRSFYALIESYGFSIKSVILARLYSQDLIQNFALESHNDCPVKAVFDIDRRIRLARWLAALLLEFEETSTPFWSEHNNSVQYSVRLEDMWEYLTIGLGVMWRISDISRDLIEAEIGLSPPWIPLSTITCGYPKVLELEHQILHLQTEYLHSVSEIGIRSFYFASKYFIPSLYSICSFRTLDSNTFGYEISFEIEEFEVRNWWKWLVLREGPDLIALAWKTNKGKENRLRFVTELMRRHKSQFLVEKAAADSIYRVIERLISQHHFKPLAYPTLLFEGDSRDMVMHWIKENGKEPGSRGVQLQAPHYPISRAPVGSVRPLRYLYRAFKLFRKY
jgi:hypothetical protein